MFIIFNWVAIPAVAINGLFFWLAASYFPTYFDEKHTVFSMLCFLLLNIGLEIWLKPRIFFIPIVYAFFALYVAIAYDKYGIFAVVLPIGLAIWYLWKQFRNWRQKVQEEDGAEV